MELHSKSTSSTPEFDYLINRELIRGFIEHLTTGDRFAGDPRDWGEPRQRAVDWNALRDAVAGSESLERAIGRAIVVADRHSRGNYSPVWDPDSRGESEREVRSGLVGRIRADAAGLVSTPKRTASAAATAVVALIALIALTMASLGGSSPPAVKAPGELGITGNAQLLQGAVPAALTTAAPVAPPTSTLPAATAPPAAAPPSLADAPPLRPHEVFGFAPYWTLSQSAGFDVSQISTLAYFSVGVNADGTLDESGPGWNGYESQALSNLITRAHGADDRVVLTVTDFDQGSLNQLTSSSSAPATLATALIGAIQAKNLDGVNLDFEGQGSGDQLGLTNLVTRVSAAIHAVNPNYQVTMDTYASSAGDPNGFYNVGALAPAVNGFFVMAYGLNLQSPGSTTSPLTSELFSQKTAIDQYVAVVPAAKVILGMPFFGVDWPTSDGTLTAQATGPATALTYLQVMASGHPIYWDSTTDTAWTSYQVDGQWHETFFEVPSSLYDAAQLATSDGLGGMGIWALGMDGNDPSLISALLGFSPAVKDYSAGPEATIPASTTDPNTTTSTSTTDPNTTTSTSTTDPNTTTSTSTTDPNTTTSTTTSDPNTTTSISAATSPPNWTTPLSTSPAVPTSTTTSTTSVSTTSAAPAPIMLPPPTSPSSTVPSWDP
jgi:hypothetical protein